MLNFVASAAVSRKPQTVTITAPATSSEQNVSASIVGLGNCPALSASKLTFTKVGGQLEASLVVTPRGAGPALCTITIARHDDDDSRRGHDCDGDLEILVLVDCGSGSTPSPSPAPTPSPTATATPSPTPTPAATPSPSPTPCTGRVC